MIRRVVTGEDRAGRSRITGDDALEFSLVAGDFRFVQLWGSDRTPQLPQDGSRPTADALMPPAGGYRYVFMRIEPRSEDVSDDDDPAVQAMYTQAGVDHAGDDGAGMHRTDTIDLGVVVYGVVAMVMEDGQVIQLKAGEVFVQNGTKHRWFNPGDVPCEIVVALIGSHSRAG